MAMLIDNQKMEAARDAIGDAKTDFETKASAFIADLTSALSTVEGETKDVLMEKKIGSSGSETDAISASFASSRDLA